MSKKKLTIQQVQLIAESLLPSFIPKNIDENVLQFNFTAEGIHWQVEFNRDGKQWKFVNAKECEEKV
jgi:hypothetical protein